jgi:MscS family membrane protein
MRPWTGSAGLTAGRASRTSSGIMSIVSPRVFTCAPALRTALFFTLTAVARAQDAVGAAVPMAGPDLTTQAAAAVASGVARPGVPDIVEHFIDFVLGLFGVNAAGNTWHHWAVAVFITLAFYVLRKAVTNLIFGGLQKLTARTKNTLDEVLFRAWRRPVAVFIAVFGVIIAVKALRLSPQTDAAFLYLKTIALAVVGLWFAIVTVAAVLDHLHKEATARGTAVAAFMPWIKKSVVALLVILGVLLAAQSLGADVGAFLAGLGIGGLAFALAAQDTIANVFGSVVVAVDQPFRLGDFVRMAGHEGTVEEIGLRSTKLRTPARTLVVIPNKAVAEAVIDNVSRMPQRRVDQTLGLTYEAKAEQLEGLLADIRALLRGDAGVHQDYIAVNFLAYAAFSLDIQIVYFTADPDVRKSFEVRERINFAIMRLVAARGLSFAFPTQTVELAGGVAERLARGLGGGRAE